MNQKKRSLVHICRVENEGMTETALKLFPKGFCGIQMCIVPLVDVSAQDQSSKSNITTSDSVHTWYRAANSGKGKSFASLYWLSIVGRGVKLLGNSVEACLKLLMLNFGEVVK